MVDQVMGGLMHEAIQTFFRELHYKESELITEREMHQAGFDFTYR
jgi:hypothetical protein